MVVVLGGSRCRTNSDATTRTPATPARLAEHLGSRRGHLAAKDLRCDRLAQRRRAPRGLSSVLGTNHCEGGDEESRWRLLAAGERSQDISPLRSQPRRTTPSRFSVAVHGVATTPIFASRGRRPVDLSASVEPAPRRSVSGRGSNSSLGATMDRPAAHAEDDCCTDSQFPAAEIIRLEDMRERAPSVSAGGKLRWQVRDATPFVSSGAFCR